MSQGQGAKQAPQVREEGEEARSRNLEHEAKRGPAMRRMVLGALVALAGLAILVSPAWAARGIVPGSFQAVALNQDGTVDVMAGSHTYAFTASFEINHDAAKNPEGSARKLVVSVPPGFVGNPTATPRCK